MPEINVKLDPRALKVFVAREACPMIFGFHDWERDTEARTEMCKRCHVERKIPNA